MSRRLCERTPEFGADFQSRLEGRDRTANTADVNPCLRSIPKFPKHGAKKTNELEMVAPTGSDHSGEFPPLAFSGTAATV
ncbi:MAG: hypothetical protein ACREKH_14150 [Candidatus Rokuibacteriota bacterium]